MRKGTKKVIGAIIIILLILAVIWLVYESIKPKPVSINTTNELPNENMGIDNVINVLFENVVTNAIENNEVVNEISNEIQVEEENTESQENNDDNNESEIVEGTNSSREERAVELAKEFYEEEYGNSDKVYFSCEEINGDGRYIVRAGNAGSGKNMFLLVDLTTGIVTKK